MRRRGAGSAWCPATSQALEPGQHALHAAPERRGRHPRRSDGRACRRARCSLVVNAALQGRATSRTSPPASRRACASSKPLPTRALLALQGPQAADGARAPRAGVPRPCGFMTAGAFRIDGRRLRSSRRSGYTGEDGFEISVAGERRRARSRARCSPSRRCKPIGLGARDSLRLEAGLCLYGHDIDETTTPIEADLAWAIGKRRRERGRISRRRRASWRELMDGADAQARRHPARGPRAGARGHAEIVDANGRRVGEITSGGFGADRRRPDRDGLCRDRRSPRRARRSRVDGARQAARRRRSRRCRSSQHRYHRG